MNTTDSLMNDDTIDGRDIRDRIEELEALDAPTEEESAELTFRGRNFYILAC